MALTALHTPHDWQQALDRARREGRQRDFDGLADDLADRWPGLALTTWLPELNAAERASVWRCEGLRVRPTTDHGLRVQLATPQAVEHFLRLPSSVRRRIRRLGLSAGLGRDHVVEALLAGDLHGLEALRVEGNNLRRREAVTWRGDDNVVHLRVEGDERLLPALAELPALRRLALPCNRLDDVAVAALGELPLAELDLRGNRIGDRGAQHLARLPLVRLLLGQNALGPEGASALAGCSTLQVLDLSHNPIGDEGARALGRTESLVELDLRACGLTPWGARGLARANTLHVLHAPKNALGDLGLGYLSALPLRRLNVARCELTELRPLRRLPLVDLEVSGNALGSAAVPGTMKPLHTLRMDRCGVADVRPLQGLGLRVLSLSGQALDPGSGPVLASLQALERLYLDDTGLGCDDARALAALPWLQVLHLAGNAVDERGVEALAGAPRLERLVLDRNPLSEHAVAVLAGADRLKRLHLRHTGVPELVLEALREALPSCEVLPG